MWRHSSSNIRGITNDLEKANTNTGTPMKERKKPNIFNEYVVDFTSNSTLHGLKYIGEKDRTWCEKIFWLLVFICCVTICGVMISQVWMKWTESPTIVSFAENPSPVWQIPYPAVTLCLETKAMQRKFNFTEYYHLYVDNKDNLTEAEQFLFEDVSMVCDDHLAPAHGRKFSSGFDTVENIKSVAPNLTDVFFGCKWKENPSENCSDLFSPILTEEGICYTFNTLGADDIFRVDNLHGDYPYLEHENTAQGWSLGEGYEPGTPLETYPNRGSGYGVKSGLTLLLRAKEIDLDYLCRGPAQGFRILLHNPTELPRLSQQYFRSSLSQEVVVAVKPKMMTTSDGLRSFSPKRKVSVFLKIPYKTNRQCYFPSERYLAYFKVYTQANCDTECLSNFTYIRCGCVHFGMPYGPNMKVCNAGSIECIKKAQMELVTIAIQSRLDSANPIQNNETETLGEAFKVSSQCQCLPACTSIEYETETSQADYDWQAIFRVHQLNIDEYLENVRFSRVMIFFKEANFVTSRRSELYGRPDVLANCGGLLGLFMGFSVLSLVEILYFLTIRLCCICRRRQKHQLPTLAPTKQI